MGYAQKNTYGKQINKLISNMCNDELTYYFLQLEEVRWTTKKTNGTKWTSLISFICNYGLIDYKFLQLEEVRWTMKKHIEPNGHY
jgi:hypothetical protein